MVGCEEVPVLNELNVQSIKKKKHLTELFLKIMNISIISIKDEIICKKIFVNKTTS